MIVHYTVVNMAKLNWDKVRVQDLGQRHGYDYEKDCYAWPKKKKRSKKSKRRSEVRAIKLAQELAHKYSMTELKETLEIAPNEFFQKTIKRAIAIKKIEKGRRDVNE